MHRPSRGRAAPRPRRHRPWQARGDGERRGRCARRPAARARGRRRRRGLFHGLWRPARAGLRDGGHAARRGLHRHRRRQGHQVPAGLPRQHARDRLGLLRAERAAGPRRRDESADVQLLPGRHQVRHRDGGDRQRHRPCAAGGRPGLPARRDLRTAHGPAPAQRGRHPAAQGDGRGRLLAAPRRQRHSRRPALGRLCRLRGRDGIRPPLLHRIRRGDRSLGPLRRAVAALPLHRARTRRLGRLGGAAGRAHRLRRCLARRRSGGGQARPARRRGARRRGRRLRLGQVHPGGTIARAGRAADRPGARHPPGARRRGGQHHHDRRRAAGPHRRGGAPPRGDGRRLRGSLPRRIATPGPKPPGSGRRSTVPQGTRLPDGAICAHKTFPERRHARAFASTSLGKRLSSPCAPPSISSSWRSCCSAGPGPSPRRR